QRSNFLPLGDRLCDGIPADLDGAVQDVVSVLLHNTWPGRVDMQRHVLQARHMAVLRHRGRPRARRALVYGQNHFVVCHREAFPMAGSRAGSTASSLNWGASASLSGLMGVRV